MSVSAYLVKQKMMHSIVNNTAPEYLTSRFVGHCDLTSHNLRENEYKLAVHNHALNFIKEVLLIAEVCYVLASGGAAIVIP